MAGEPVITIVGNLTADPDLRFTAAGHAVANLTVASTPRTFDRQSNDWKDGETLFVRGSVWREMSENVAESLTKGMRVVVQGRLRAKSFETRDGDQRTNWEMDIDEIGPSMRYATAKVTKTPPKNQGGFSTGPQSAEQGSWGGQSQGQADPWAGSQTSAGDWGTPQNEDPPF